MQRDRKRPVGGLRLDPERFQEFDEIGVGSRVERNKASVERDVLTIDGRNQGIRMTSEPSSILVDDDVVMAVRKPRRGKPHGAGANDRNHKTTV
jgi:hypothetical protein